MISYHPRVEEMLDKYDETAKCIQRMDVGKMIILIVSMMDLCPKGEEIKFKKMVKDTFALENITKIVYSYKDMPMWDLSN